MAKMAQIKADSERVLECIQEERLVLKEEMAKANWLSQEKSNSQDKNKTQVTSRKHSKRK